MLGFAVVYSCRHLQTIGKATKHKYPDGLYKIYPGKSKKPLLVYCDMTRDGGGWTLLVTSHTNTWTAQNVLLRNPGSPQIDGDYSILSHADGIKDYLHINGTTFEYRLEAQKFGKRNFENQIKCHSILQFFETKL